MLFFRFLRGTLLTLSSRIIDLSQGLDRELDQRASGLAGCLTPRGQHFITSRGRPLLGIEALALQGIPIDRLLLSNDSQKDLHDLAGNAMSSTVVGAAILSALIIAHKALLPGPAPCEIPESPVSSMDIDTLIVDKQSIRTLSVDLSELKTLSTHEALEGSKRSVRLCLCEGQTLTKQSGLSRCLKCGHTACIKCGRNPFHKYEAISSDELSARINPMSFETLLKRKLPMRLRVNGLESSIFRSLQGSSLSHDEEKAWLDFLKTVEVALGEELRFWKITRENIWTVMYRGNNSLLRLVCRNLDLEWSLYVLPPKNEPSNSPLRQMLRCPIAQMSPCGAGILEGPWRIYAPFSSNFGLKVCGKKDRVPSSGAKGGLQHPNFSDSKVWNQINISAADEDMKLLEFDIRGDYELLQDCGAASGSLHKKMTSKTEPAMYFFLDPTEIGPVELDSWVFSHYHDRLNIGESRVTVAEIRPNWKAATLSQEPSVVRCWYRRWIVCTGVYLGAYLSETPAIYQIPEANPIFFVEGAHCHNSYVPMLECSVPATGSELESASAEWQMVNLTTAPAHLEQFAWLLQGAISIDHFDQWKIVNSEDESFEAKCLSCSPLKPKLKWALGDRDQVYPYEDPQDAAIYEQNVTARPASFLAFTRLTNERTFRLRICLNIVTLLHQARGKLLNPKDVSLHWRLCIDNIGFLRQRLPKIQESSNKDDVESVQPPGFKRFPLRAEQLRSLTWMKAQENKTDPFQEEEVVETMLPVINWRAEGKATTDKIIRGGILGDDVGYGKTAITLGLIDSQYEDDSVSTPTSGNGAIPIKATLIVVPHHLIDQWSREIKKFLVSKYDVLEIKTVTSLRQLNIDRMTKADIILLSSSVLRGVTYYTALELFAACPALPRGEGRIFDEWMSDAISGVREHVDLLVDLGSEALQQSVVAKNAILRSGEGYSKYKPSKRLKGQKLQDYLAKLKREARYTPPGDDFLEQQSQIPKQASRNTRKQIKELSIGQKRKATSISNGVMTDENDEPNKKAKSTARRNLSKPKETKTTEELGVEAEKVFCLQNCKNDWKRMKSPLIHMFEFNRIVIDEFTYSKDRNYTSILAIPARKRWILSGTPPLNDFADVKSFSPFLGITLGVDDDERRSENERLRAIQRERTGMLKTFQKS